MRSKIPLVLAIVVTLLMGGSGPSPFQRSDVQHGLNDLLKRGFTYRMLDNEMVEITEPVSGTKLIRSLRQPDEGAIRSWAAQRHIPVLEIDPNTIDTSRYTGWFRYWSTVPLSNTGVEPLLVGDAVRNANAEVYGLYLDDNGNQSTRIYQVDTAGSISSLFDYSPRLGLALGLIDSNNDSLLEFAMSYGGTVFDFAQSSRMTLPTVFMFEHQRYQSHLDPGGTHVFFGNLDNDPFLDFLYKGSELDSTDTTIAYGKVYVAEYSPQQRNFVRAWSRQYMGGGEGGTVGFAVGDFDGDGQQEFVVADDMSGRVFVTENTGNNSYSLTWEDSIPFVNVSALGSGDADGDGKPEFFVGATIYNGDWTTVFEADSDNSFSAKFIIHLLSGGTFDILQYMTTDVDGDGTPELVICAGSDIYMFKCDSDNHYYLWYLKRENARDAIQFYDFNRDGRKDFIISKTEYVGPPAYFRYYADIYVGTQLVSAEANHGKEEDGQVALGVNYPNPFNPSTTIRFSLPSRLAVTLTIYDIRGGEVELLLNKTMDPGSHSVTWSGAEKCSGVYFCCLRAGSATVMRKLVLLH